METSTARAAELPHADTEKPIRVRVVPVHALDHQTEGPTRGYAHIGFGDHPPGAPGHLDFDPLVLFAVGEMFPGEGVPMHRHENIENILLVVSGRCRHADSLGNTAVLGAGDVSLLSAGSGMEHAESVEGDEPVHALVIWLRPEVLDAEPAAFVGRGEPRPSNRLSVLASGRPQHPDEALPLRADAALLTAKLDGGASLDHVLDPGRSGYLLVLEGHVSVDGTPVGPGERALIDGSGTLELRARDDAELYLIDVRRG